jgi:hypothetical protein
MEKLLLFLSPPISSHMDVHSDILSVPLPFKGAQLFKGANSSRGPTPQGGPTPHPTIPIHPTPPNCSTNRRSLFFKLAAISSVSLIFLRPSLRHGGGEEGDGCWAGGDALRPFFRHGGCEEGEDGCWGEDVVLRPFLKLGGGECAGDDAGDDEKW